MTPERTHTNILQFLRETQEGIAIVTVVLVLAAVTILGIAALTVTGMEGRMAGFARTGEAASSAAESCVDTGMQIVLQTLDISSGGQLPAAFDAPGGPVQNHNALEQELLGQNDNNTIDSTTATPNLVMSINSFTVNGDIDRLYVQPKPGTQQCFDCPQTGSAEIIYRIDCVSANTATGASSRITGVYACTLAGDGCIRAL